MALVYLVRHGQTAWNKAKIFRGRKDIPLNDTGRREAECCAEMLKNIRLSRVYASPLSRAVETAVIVAARHGLPACNDPAFLDIDYGDWTGRADVEIREQLPDAYRTWKDSPHLMRFPGGESLDDVRQRAVARLLELGRSNSNAMMGVVSHRVVVKLLLAEAKGLDNSHFWKIACDTASISILEVSRDGIGLIVENDTRHLKALEGHDSVDF